MKIESCTYIKETDTYSIVVDVPDADPSEVLRLGRQAGKLPMSNNLDITKHPNPSRWIVKTVPKPNMVY